ncbi:MAG: MoaD/ThiS family protein [Planctomycetota bacterium]|nr:MAG: MoaD/ThiS family protein [Planctomycetota bacterium]
MATVRIPTPLRPFTGGKEEVAIAGATVAELVTNLGEAHPDLKARILTAEGGVRRFINLYVNDADIRTLSGVDTAVTDNDTVAIVPAIAGG